MDRRWGKQRQRETERLERLQRFRGEAARSVHDDAAMAIQSLFGVVANDGGFLPGEMTVVVLGFCHFSVHFNVGSYAARFQIRVGKRAYGFPFICGEVKGILEIAEGRERLLSHMSKRMLAETSRLCRAA
jgi:hypothetical protein